MKLILLIVNIPYPLVKCLCWCDFVLFPNETSLPFSPSSLLIDRILFKQLERGGLTIPNETLLNYKLKPPDFFLSQSFKMILISDAKDILS